MDFSKLRVLVTGGAGFIGSALVWELNRRGCENVVITDVLGTSEKWKNLAPLCFEDYLEADDLFPRLGAKALGNFDLVLHLGACSSTTERDASHLIRNNFEYTKQLAAWSLANNAWFVYASSAATYGDGSAGMSDSGHESWLQAAVRDGDRSTGTGGAEPDIGKFRPLNMYGYSKHLFDLYAKRHGFLDRIVGLKYFNVFGPNEAHKDEMRSLVNKAYKQVVDTGVIRLFKSYRPEYKDGEQRRDFLYVKDAVAMTLHLAAQSGAGGLFNIGSGEAHTWVELANAVFVALGKPPRIEFVDMPVAIRDKYQYFTQADIGKLRAAGYESPITPLNDAVADYVKNYLVPNRHLGD